MTTEHTIQNERRRGFQPPWYTVRIYRCVETGETTTVRVPRHGFGPGAIIGNCGHQLRLA